MNVGDYVRGVYKTGVYGGELLELEPEKQRALVKVLAVFKHPTQGDLHNPKQINVPLFHQRKALAQYEKAWMPLSSLKKLEEDLPAYKDSLKTALQKQKEALAEEASPWAEQSLVQLEELEKEYGL
ncbi:kinase-associated lipoprotein B [Halalkalibacterium ligniniphilum]|uniref:kinase-associated lipoprotein B n=1 Tax=Halalkalibacterium ligniniphilum TaxID=1134413 RepID=UPI0003458132|nr:kinase-associated lipoprotein B [Halalkalibacterium ligniniphilum]